MKRQSTIACVAAGGCLITISLLGQQALSEAPAGFNTPTLQVQNA